MRAPALPIIALLLTRCSAYSWTLGAPTINPPRPTPLATLPFPASAIATGLYGPGHPPSRSTFWSAGGHVWRGVGAAGGTRVPPTLSPDTPVLGPGPSGAVDSGGHYLTAVFPTPSGGLVGFSRSEYTSFNCSPPTHGEAWRTGMVLSSNDGGGSWAKLGVAVADDAPCTPMTGGTTFSSVVQNGTGFLAFSGTCTLRSLDPAGSPGSWKRLFCGHFGCDFTEPGVQGMCTAAVGLSYDAVDPSVVWDAGLGMYVMVHSVKGDAQTLWVAFSTLAGGGDMLRWSDPQILVRVSEGTTVGSGAVVGGLLTYAVTPPTGSAPVDWVVRSVKWGE